MTTRLEIAERLVAQVQQTKYDNSKAVQRVFTDVREQAIAWFGAESSYVRELDQIERDRHKAANRMSSQWQVLQKLLPVTEAMREEVRLDRAPEGQGPAPAGAGGGTAPAPGREIVIAGSQDEAMKVVVGRSLEKLGLRGIVLSQDARAAGLLSMPAGGADGAGPDVGFAIVLLGPDDFGYAAADPAKNAKPRPGQDAVFELGYFLGRLGRERVLALYRPVESCELPSDPSHLLFTPWDASGRWQFDLARQLKACGYAIDAGGLFS
jgi:hypothetical protein